MWSGMLSLPRVLWLAEDKTLRMTSAEELAILRADHKTSGGRTVKADTEAPLKDISGDSLELCVEMAARKAASYGIKVLCSPDGQEQTIVFYDAIERKLKIDTTRSSLGGGLKSVEGGPLELAPDEPLRLKIFVDRSVVEVFANDRQAVARCVYPTRDDSLGVVLFSRGGPAEVAGMDAWKMSPANPW